MRVVADEGVDRSIVERLREQGHVVDYIAELHVGMTDEDVLDLANGTEALLLTQDKDFGELVFRQNRVTSGILLIRLEGLAPTEKAGLVVRAIALHGDQMRSGFAVLTPRSLRIRGSN